jgi:putative ABC transport system permease protein
MSVQPRGTARERVNGWIAQLLQQVEVMPGVESAGAVYLTPMEMGSIGQGTWAVAEGQPETPETANANPSLNYLTATPDYFTAMRIPLKQGRLFNDGDRASNQRVAIVSESTAGFFFPGQNPIGKRIKAAGFDGKRDFQGAWRTIVGVVGNVRYRGLKEVQLEIYDAPMQSLTPTTSIVIKLKRGEARNGLAVASAIQSRAREMDAQALVSNITTLEQVVDKEMAPWRFSAWVFAVFAALAFSLSMLGLFSLVSLDVTNRRREFAIRMAVGATPRHIVANVFTAAGSRAGIGITAGLLVALIATRSLDSLLFGVNLGDAVTYASVTLLVLTVVFVASYLPARKAGAAEPLALLRRD